MLDNIRTKMRALVEDFSKNDFEPFTYESGDKKFILAESNIISIIEVEKNGIELGSGEYDYHSSTNELEITTTLSSGDIIVVKYTYYKYSDTELNGYTIASLVWISTFSHESETDYEIENNEIYPTPDNKTIDLISLVGAIIIKPDWSRYSLPNMTVVYPRTMPKEDRIEKLIMRFNSGLGTGDVLTFAE
jgi:hypothetical protein